MHRPSFLFHDYETWGANPRQDYPCQFAAIRTDHKFNQIEDEVNWVCQIPNDYLPHPQACLITGITPQFSLTHGMNEYEFATKIYDMMSVPNTCALGYNSLRFDDEVSRFLFYRNFFDPYAREWQQGNSRWDIIDLARACYVLRPEGVEWAFDNCGTVSFKLENLSRANGITHDNAHDALADVYATIELAKIINNAQPRLFDYAMQLRDKRTVLKHINFDDLTPLFHVSSKIPATQHCCTWILPIGYHPIQKGCVVCIDLRKNPNLLIEQTTEEIRQQLFTPSTELDNSERPGLKLIHLNKSPFIAPANSMSNERAEELQLNKNQCLKHYQQLSSHFDKIQDWLDVYRNEWADQETATHAEYNLYKIGFLSDQQKREAKLIQQCAGPDSSMSGIEALLGKLSDPLIRALLFRFRGRNYPESFTQSELIDWQHHRQNRLEDGENSLSIKEFAAELDIALAKYHNHPSKMAIVNALRQYVESL